MDEERLQRAIDIILDGQAQFYADLQKMQEVNREIRDANKESQENHRKAEKRISVLERACVNLYNITVKHDGQIGEQSKNIDKLSVEIRELRDAQKETGERLDAVIFMAEKFFSGQNGKSKK